jgi:hypothetical protein
MKKADVNNLIKATLIQEVEFLNSNDNINKNGNRNLVRLEDARYKTTIRSIQSIASMLDNKEDLDEVIQDARKLFNELLYGSELVAKSTSCKSQARHRFNVAFDKKMRELVAEGVLEYHPLESHKVVLVDTYQSKEMKANDKPTKKAFLNVAPNVTLHSYFDQVVKVEKVVKS